MRCAFMYWKRDFGPWLLICLPFTLQFAFHSFATLPMIMFMTLLNGFVAVHCRTLFILGMHVFAFIGIPCSVALVYKQTRSNVACYHRSCNMLEHFQQLFFHTVWETHEHQFQKSFFKIDTCFYRQPQTNFCWFGKIE